MRHILVMASSSGLGLLAIFLVDFADLFFISMLGEDALAAAIGYSGTVLFFVTSVGIGLAISIGALSARALGRGDPESAREVAGSVFALIAVMGVICAALLIVFTPQLLDLLGATGVARDYSVGYLQITAFGAPFLMIGMAGGAVLRAHGDANRSMMTTITAAIVNGVLDPILIFALDLGLTGAAIATVISRVVLATVALWPLLKRYDAVAFPSASRIRTDSGAVFGIAGPAILTNLATPVGNAIVTRMMAGFGTEAVAGYAIVGRLTPLAFCFLFSLSGAVGPIIGQNFGAGKTARVRETFTNALIVVGLYTLAISAVLYLLRGQLAALFGAEGEALTLLFLFCGPLSLAFVFNGALFAANATFNNLDRPLYSTGINWARHTLGTLPFALLGAHMMGAGGVLIGQFLGGAVFGIAAIWMAYRLIDEHGEGPPPKKFRDLRVVRRGMALIPFSDWRP